MYICLYIKMYTYIYLCMSVFIHNISSHSFMHFLSLSRSSEEEGQVGAREVSALGRMLLRRCAIPLSLSRMVVFRGISNAGTPRSKCEAVPRRART